MLFLAQPCLACPKRGSFWVMSGVLLPIRLCSPRSKSWSTGVSWDKHWKSTATATTRSQNPVTIRQPTSTPKAWDLQIAGGKQSATLNLTIIQGRNTLKSPGFADDSHILCLCFHHFSGNLLFKCYLGNPQPKILLISGQLSSLKEPKSWDGDVGRCSMQPVRESKRPISSVLRDLEAWLGRLAPRMGCNGFYYWNRCPKKCSVFKGSRRVTLRRIEQSLTIIDHNYCTTICRILLYFAGGAMHQICPVEEWNVLRCSVERWKI